MLGAPSSTYWVGYQYNATGMPVDANDQVIGQQESAILNDMSNFVSGETAGDGVCVAINNEGLFQNLDCAMPMPYICANAYRGKPQQVGSVTLYSLSSVHVWSALGACVISQQERIRMGG